MLINRWRCNKCARSTDVPCIRPYEKSGKPTMCPYCQQSKGFWHVGTFDGEQQILSHTISVDKYPAG
jgi:NAD-dependent SIR2 family protein deacetylase